MKCNSSKFPSNQKTVAKSTKIFNNFENYIYCLGFFWQNFNNLELQLRIYLNRKSGNDGFHVRNCLNMKVGEECKENAITDFKSFGDLCKSFNSYQEENNKIDFNDFIALRDALAHGRVAGDNSGNMSVIKYSKPKNGKAIVEYKLNLSIEEMKKIGEKIAKIGMDISFIGGAKII